MLCYGAFCSYMSRSVSDYTDVQLFKSKVKCSKLKIKSLKCVYYVLHV